MDVDSTADPEIFGTVFMEACWAAGVSIKAYDPVARDETRRIYGERDDLEYCETAEAALVNADALVVVTEWREFRSPDFDTMLENLTLPIVIDGRNIYDPVLMRNKGFSYYAIGRI